MTLRTLAVFALLTAAAATTGAQFMPGPWYAALAKPDWTPPNWLFGPVWTMLYILMAVAAWRVYRKRGFDLAVGTWLAQLAVNAAWTPLFFGLHRIDLALLDILVLDVLVLATIVLFWRRDRVAAALMLPYLAWIAFATVLNASILKLNPM